MREKREIGIERGKERDKKIEGGRERKKDRTQVRMRRVKGRH